MPAVELTVELHLRPALRRGTPDGRARVVTVVWEAPASGRPQDRWVVGVVLEPVDGGPPLRHRRSVVSDGPRPTVEIAHEIVGAPGRVYRGIATLHRCPPAGGPATVAGFAELGLVSFDDPAPRRRRRARGR